MKNETKEILRAMQKILMITSLILLIATGTRYFAGIMMWRNTNDKLYTGLQQNRLQLKKGFDMIYT